MTPLSNFIKIRKEISELSINTKVIVVSKTFDINDIYPIINYGHLDFGEINLKILYIYLILFINFIQKN